MKLNQALINRAMRISAQAHAVQHDLTAAFRERYGTTYSDVDCDALIDLFDYGGGSPITVAYCDEQMANCGAPRIMARPSTGGAMDGEGLA